MDAVERLLDPIEAKREDMSLHPEDVSDYDAYVFGPTTVKLPPGPIETEREIAMSDWLASRDASYECEHGNLPGDRVIDCDCWKSKSRRVLTPDEAAALTKAATPISSYGDRDGRLEPPAAGLDLGATQIPEIPVSDYDPEVVQVVDELVADIDGAISKLQSAKEVLR